MIINKTNRCCKLIQGPVNNFIILQEQLKAFDYYMFLNNPIIHQCIPNSNDITRLNKLMSDNIIRKVIASDDETKGLLKIPFKFIEDIKNKVLDLTNKNLTIKYTYDIKFHSEFHRERVNYRPKVINDSVQLTIFEHRPKKY